MAASAGAEDSSGSWSVDALPFDQVDRDSVRNDETLFYLLVTASFIESGSDLYTTNLIEHYRDFPPVARWLKERWEHEELQHGAALSRYVRTVWPEYPWQPAFEAFFADYRLECRPDQLETDPLLELAARCVIEMGTASYYRMLFEAVREPVLRQLLDHIRRDEVRHFKNFYHHLRAADANEKPSRWRIARCLVARTLEMTRDDGWHAFRNAYRFRHADNVPTRTEYDAWRGRIRSIAKAHFPARMAAEMVLAPLDLSPRWRNGSVRVIASALRRVL